MEQTKLPPKSGDENGATETDAPTFHEPTQQNHEQAANGDGLPPEISIHGENQDMRADGIEDPSKQKNTPEANRNITQ